MAQTGSAQREPSMEEILASIRRIIEDSDTARPPVEDNLVQPKQPAEPEPTDGGQLEVEAFRAGLDEPAAPAGTVEETGAIEQSAEPEPQTAMPGGVIHAIHHSEPVAASVAEPVFDDTAEPEQAYDAGDALPEDAAPEAVSETDEPEVGLIEDDLALAAEEQPEPAGQKSTSIEPAPATAETAKAAIISDHASRQVAASFGELSEAFAASRRRSFDQIAEEMLRPMLQDWLDNNLPTLVERLVREEIERVARGGQG